MQGVPKARVHVPTDAFRFSTGWARNASHSSSVGARYRAGTWTSLIPHDPARQAPPACPAPTVHFKPIASGEIVLTATGTSLAARLRDTYDHAAAVEMESAGVAQAAHLNRSLPVLSVRGISDRANAGKRTTDAAGWQHVAARRAAALTISTAALALQHAGAVEQQCVLANVRSTRLGLARRAGH